jgi:isocitrate dehydrogenase
MLTARGMKVWPDGQPETLRVDECRCRFVGANGAISQSDVVGLLARITSAQLAFVKTEGLFQFDGERGYSLGQGE